MATQTVTPADAPAPASDVKVKPSKPNEDLFKKELAQAEANHKVAMDNYNAIRDKIDLAFPNKKNGAEESSPEKKRRQDLINERNEIRKAQAGSKSSRAAKLDQIKRLDEQIKSRTAEQKAARGKVAFKTVEELDARIRELETQVNSGTMKIVDEKKNLADISSLNRIKKNFGQFAESQKQIDDLRAKVKEIRDSMGDPEQKAISERYATIQAELDTMQSKSDEVFKNLSTLRDEKKKLHLEQQATYAAIKQLKDDYHNAKRAYATYEQEQRAKHRERIRAEREKAYKDAQKARAQEMLQTASLPAFADQIRLATSLLKFLDPSAVSDAKAPLLADRGLAATDIRKVDASAAPKGTVLVRKEDRDEEFITSAASKKGKKNKKATTTSASESARGFNCPPSVVQDCSYIGVEPPMSAAEVPSVIEQVKAKLEEWKNNQAAETQKNMEKAKKEIERLEQEDEAERGTDA
ncbi:multicopy suppressor of BFA (Brefeldin A) [Ceratocystis pirilliformis]|uniref:Multicopy suppressor of BFA (Brefeldin A) n=1 Tax=Ceratocystis pirilliformis TaxID=259994 RepID=A0ABR3YSA4_9PEZI